MKILWFSNHPASIVKTNSFSAKYAGQGWVGALEEILSDEANMEIALAFPDKTITELKKEQIGNRTIYRIPFPKSKLKRWKNRFFDQLEDETYIAKYISVVDDFNPDLIHVYGTENSFGEIIPRVKQPVVIDLQGILTGILPKWFSCITPKEAYKFSSLKSKLNINTHYHFYKSKFKRAEREQRILKSSKYILGRTHYDKLITTALAPSAIYFHCKRGIRQPFWNHSWQSDSIALRQFTTIMNPDFYKGFDVILRSASILKKLNFQFEWNIAGLTADNDMVRIVEKKANLRSKDYPINFLGKKTAEELASLLSRSSLLIHPSYIENSPNSVAEAMMVGTPVIATNVGGIPSMIKNDETGWLFQEGDALMLSGLLIDLYKSTENMIRVAASGKTQTRNLHHPVIIKKDLMHAYNSILNLT